MQMFLPQPYWKILILTSLGEKLSQINYFNRIYLIDRNNYINLYKLHTISFKNVF